MPNPPAEDDEAAAGKRRQAALDASFTGFFTRNRHSVQEFLRRLEADRGMVEDVSQEAFMAIRAKWEDAQHYQDPRAYVIGVARNILREHQRKRGRTQTLYIDDLSLPEVPAPATPREAADRLAGWIQLLPPRIGEVMSLHLDKHPDRQIALLLGISHNTVREYLVVGRRKLLQLAADDGFTVPAGRRRR